MRVVVIVVAVIGALYWWDRSKKRRRALASSYSNDARYPARSLALTPIVVNRRTVAGASLSMRRQLRDAHDRVPARYFGTKATRPLGERISRKGDGSFFGASIDADAHRPSACRLSRFGRLL